ncbi:Hypothetical predicted protein [Octopus vulgaris]|uniref:Uncharacterized protein n=1 Tax=Octopus vulgaris TaxID=6645 RepID=A0AA36BUS3_OCTVU|nr:Hypothetical predicted protein [Octopus vulgaris]
MVTWRNVYWRLWGLVNYLHCTWCNEMFSCAQFGHCLYHPEEPQFQTAAGRDGETVSSKLVSPIGHYPCCNQTVCRFDPANLNLGCQARDHIVKPLVNKEDSTKDISEETCNLFKDLIAHRDIISISYNNTNDFYLWESSDLEGPQYSQDESDDEIGDNEVMKAPRTHVKKNQVNHTQNLLFDAPEFQPTQKSLWNTQRSVRHNQDAQRQEDQRRMKEMIMYLTKLRLDTEKVEKPKKEYPAGSFSRIEGQWRNHILPNMKNLNQPFARAKFRFGPIK